MDKDNILKVLLACMIASGSVAVAAIVYTALGKYEIELQTSQLIAQPQQQQQIAQPQEDVYELPYIDLDFEILDNLVSYTNNNQIVLVKMNCKNNSESEYPVGHIAFNVNAYQNGDELKEVYQEDIYQIALEGGYVSPDLNNLKTYIPLINPGSDEDFYRAFIFTSNDPVKIEVSVNTRVVLTDTIELNLS